MKNYLILHILLFCITSFSFAQQTLIHCGTIIDGKSKKIQNEMTIIVEGNKIKSIEKGYVNPGDQDIVIDLKEKTVMPGFTDMHVHLEGELNPRTYLNEFQNNEADIAYEAAVYAKRTLMAGFTTVRDLGGSGVNSSLRDAINKGYVSGPRIYSAGKAIGTTGGHADPTNGYRKDLMGDPGPEKGVINGPDEAMKAVRQRYKNGADVIKITATGGVLSVAKDGSGPQFTQEEVNAIVEIAREYGMVTAAHAHGAEGMKRAVLAGISTIEHGTLMSEEVMDLMIQKGTYYVPTISAGEFVYEKAQIEGYFPPVIVPKALEIGPKIYDTFSKAYKKGVKIAFGTDAGVSPHGDNGKEFGFMVKGGMSPIEAILSATIVPAQILKIDDTLGTIEAGKIADIVASDQNPLKDISTLERISFVMKGGVVYKMDGVEK